MTSGTTSFNLSISDVIEEACDRAGVDLRTGFDLISARRRLNLMALEWANRGLNLWTVDQQVLPLVAGTATYTLPGDTVDVLDAVVRTYPGDMALQFDQVIPRISFTTYNAIANKLSQGRPIQYSVARQQAAPVVTFWQVPDSSAPYQFVYFRMRRMQDVGTSLDNTEDVPFRFLPSLVAGLAYYTALAKNPERVDMLRALYEQTFQEAADEDRERATFRWVPRIGY